jgi:hypothetical protein
MNQQNNRKQECLEVMQHGEKSTHGGGWRGKEKLQNMAGKSREQRRHTPDVLVPTESESIHENIRKNIHAHVSTHM